MRMMLFDLLATGSNIGAEALSATPVQFGLWMVCAIAALKGWNELQKARGRDRIPEPMTVRGEVRYATHEELVSLKQDLVRLQEQWHREFAELEGKIDENYRQTIKAGESRATKIHERINELPWKVMELINKQGAVRIIPSPAPGVPPES